MKKILSLLVAITFVALSFTSCTTADSSEVALVVDQVGNDAGTPNVQMKSGFIFYFPPTQDVFSYKTNVQHEEWTKEKTKHSDGGEQIDVTTSDTAPIGLDVALNVQLQRARAADLFIKYRVSMEDILDTRVKGLVRKQLIDIATLYTIDSLIQHRGAYEAHVTRILTPILEKEGFTLNNIAVTKLHMSDGYIDAINKKVKVIQETATIKSETEQAVQIAAKKVATAKGDYEAAQFNAKTKEIMSQPKMLALYEAETARIWADKGVSPYGSNNVFGANTNVLLNK